MKIFKLYLIFLVVLSRIVFSMTVIEAEKDIGTKYELISYKTLLSAKEQDEKIWVSVYGIVYDLTNSRHWRNGNHKGRHTSSQDLTYDILKLSPHGLKKLENQKIVGILAFTIEDLKKFNGRNGKKAYVAINGIVYDVTHSNSWKENMKSFEYGFELTYESQRIEIGKLDNVYPVGILVMDLNDLKKFNGKNAEKAYVAVEGNVYDLTFLKAWKNGEHMNLHTAGNELTYDILKRSPHGLKKLEKALKVGTLIFWSIPEGYSKENFVVFKDGLKIGYLIH